MKTLKFIAALFLTTTISMHAQDIKWSYVHDGSHHADDEAGFSMQGRDGKIYSSGIINEDSLSQAFVVRLDLQGNEIWNYTYPDTLSYTIVGSQDANMNLYFGGQIHTAATHDDVLVISLDTLGALRWSYRYDTDSMDDFIGYGIYCWQ